MQWLDVKFDYRKCCIGVRKRLRQLQSRSDGRFQRAPIVRQRLDLVSRGSSISGRLSAVRPALSVPFHLFEPHVYQFLSRAEITL